MPKFKSSTAACWQPFVVLGLLIFSSISSAQQGVPAWNPPAVRANRTPLAPRPVVWDNIFKKEAEQWLTEAILEVEPEYLPALDDEGLRSYVSKVGQHLASQSTDPSRKYEFVLVSRSDLKAATAGSGRIFISLGVLRFVQSEDELAGILAHEIAHDAFKHIPVTVTRQLFWMTGVRKVSSPEETEKALEDLNEKYRESQEAQFFEMLLGFSRIKELEADRAAFYTMFKAGYNPRALEDVFQRWDAEERKELGASYGIAQFFKFLLSSHPPNPQRASALAWEASFLTMPSRDERYKSPAFDAMKARVAALR